MLSACDQEHDEAKIAANREAYNKNHAANPPRNPPLDAQNCPLKYNRHQVLVVDSQCLKDEQSLTTDTSTTMTTTTSSHQCRNRCHGKDKDGLADVVPKEQVRTLLSELRSDPSVSSPSPMQFKPILAHPVAFESGDRVPQLTSHLMWVWLDGFMVFLTTHWSPVCCHLFPFLSS